MKVRGTGSEWTERELDILRETYVAGGADGASRALAAEGFERTTKAVWHKACVLKLDRRERLRELERFVHQGLVPHDPGDIVHMASSWASLPDDALKRRAMAAAGNRDTIELVNLMLAFVVTKSRSRGQVSRSTMRSYSLAAAQLVRAWGHENLLRPSRNAADLWVASMAQRYAPATVAVRMAGARRLYDALRWAGATDADPFLAVKPPLDPTPAWERRQPYSADEVHRLLAVADTRMRTVVLLGAHAGLRASEITRLTWRQVDWEKGAVSVVNGKGGKSRTAYASPALLNALQAQRALSTTTLVVGVRYSRLAKLLYALCDEAGVQRRGIHALRHHAGTQMMRATNNLLDVAQHLGHSSIEMSRIYAKWSPDAVRKAVGAWV